MEDGKKSIAYETIEDLKQTIQKLKIAVAVLSVLLVIAIIL